MKEGHTWVAFLEGSSDPPANGNCPAQQSLAGGMAINGVRTTPSCYTTYRRHSTGHEGLVVSRSAPTAATATSPRCAAPGRLRAMLCVRSTPLDPAHVPPAARLPLRAFPLPRSSAPPTRPRPRLRL